MVVITVTLLVVAFSAVTYWVGRGHSLNQRIRAGSEDVAFNPETGEVIERGSPEWNAAEKQGNVRFQ